MDQAATDRTEPVTQQAWVEAFVARLQSLGSWADEEDLSSMARERYASCGREQRPVDAAMAEYQSWPPLAAI